MSSLCSLCSWALNAFHVDFVHCVPVFHVHFCLVPCVPGLLICSMFYVHCIHCVPCLLCSLCSVLTVFTVFHVLCIHCVPYSLCSWALMSYCAPNVSWRRAVRGTERSLSCHQRELARNYQTTHNIGLRLFRIYKLNSILVRAERGWIIIGSWVSSQVSC